MKRFRKYLLTMLLALCCLAGHGQDAAMADGLRAEGKIYVVVIIILIVLTGLIAYLFLMDRKLTRLEKRLKTPQTKQ